MRAFPRCPLPVLVSKATGAGGLHVVSNRLKELGERCLKFGAVFIHGGAVRVCGTASLCNEIHGRWISRVSMIRNAAPRNVLFV